jgi:hypothetical protein
MPAKCDRCGVETNCDASFFKARKSFSKLVLTYCPTCWLKRHHSAVKWVFLSNLGLGALGLALVLVWPEVRAGRVFINLFFIEIFLMLTILPHELGHAWMARLLGMRVFKIYVGSGKTLFSVKLFGFDAEFRAVPMGGLVVATHRSIQWLRAKQLAFVLAGPVVNLLLAAAAWPFLDPEQLWSFLPMGQGVQLGLTFFYANLAILFESLWPHNVATVFGALPSDGKQLFLTFFLTHEKRELHHAMNFAMEVHSCHERGDYEGARSWLEKGLALYPDNETLLNWDGIIGLELMEYEKARECFMKLLHHDSKQPLMRPLMQNNIAYTNALLGGDELLKEADEFSQAAMTAMSWMPAVRGTRGTVLVAMGRIEEALPMLHDAMVQADSPPHKASNACMISIAEARRGNFDVARNYLEEARKLEPKCSLLSRAETVLREASLPTA